jgi:cellulose 1,4-beta-cellobiosidase
MIRNIMLTSTTDYYQCLPGTGNGVTTPATSAPPASTPATQVPTTLKTSTTSGTPVTVTPAPGDGSNPLKGKSFYANPYYASEIISLAAPSLSAAGSAALAAKATNVAKVGTFYWL